MLIQEQEKLMLIIKEAFKNNIASEHVETMLGHTSLITGKDEFFAEIQSKLCQDEEVV